MNNDYHENAHSKRMDYVKIILVDWRGYPLKRRKRIGKNIIECGLENILQNMTQHKAGVDFDITLIITRSYYLLKKYRILRKFFKRNKTSEDFLINENKKEIYQNLATRYDFVSSVLFKNNTGQDIGAYNKGYQELKKAHYKGDVVFMNSALGGPSEDNWLLKYKKLFDRDEDIGLCGISMNPYNTQHKGKPFSPHIQSFFLYTSMNILAKIFPKNLCGYNIKLKRRKLIEQGEIGISQKILNSGYGITCIAYPAFVYKKNKIWAIPFEEFRYKKEFRQFANQL